MDDALILELTQAIDDVRLFTIAPRPHTADALMYEYLIVVPENLKGKLSALLWSLGEGRCDVVASETFDRLAPPAYFHRCKEVSLRAMVAAATARRRERERAEQARRDDDARLQILVVSHRETIAAGLEAALRLRSPSARIDLVRRPEDATAHFHDRLDCVVIDAAIPDWGAVRVVDWLQPFCPCECVALLVTTAAEERVWSLLRSRGVRRIEGVDAELAELLEAARRRNLTRRPL